MLEPETEIYAISSTCSRACLRRSSIFPSIKCYADASFVTPNDFARICVSLLRRRYQREAIWDTGLSADVKCSALFCQVANGAAHRRFVKSY
jgi:hypothetical protein